MEIVIRLIFPLFIIFLSVLPCSDKMAIDNTIGSFISTADDAHNDDETHMCSPFCTCSCCSAQIRIVSVFEINTLEFAHNTKVVTPYAEKSSVDNSRGIWQPPKVA